MAKIVPKLDTNLWSQTLMNGHLSEVGTLSGPMCVHVMIRGSIIPVTRQRCRNAHVNDQCDKLWV